MNTELNNNSTNIIYIEINQLLNKKPTKNKKMKPTDNLYYSQVEIIDEIFKLLVLNFDNQTSFLKDKTGIKVIITDKNQFCIFEIIVCFTYNLEYICYNNLENNKLIIEQPKKFIINYNLKNNMTNNLLKQYTILIKENLTNCMKTYVAPIWLIETLLYNVPNALFKTYSFDNYLIIINYIRNKSFSNLITINNEARINNAINYLDYKLFIKMLNKSLQ